MLQASGCQWVSNTPQWVFCTFFKLYKGTRKASHINNMKTVILTSLHICSLFIHLTRNLRVFLFTVNKMERAHKVRIILVRICRYLARVKHEGIKAREARNLVNSPWKDYFFGYIVAM